METKEILEKFAPEFVALDGYSEMHSHNENILVLSESLRALLDAHAQALVKLEKAREALQIYASVDRFGNHYPPDISRAVLAEIE